MSTRHLFEAIGLELEYMIVKEDTLEVAPCSDELLHAYSGNYEGEVVRGPFSWSNEVVLHVVEFKTSEPCRNFIGIAEGFSDQIREANRHLSSIGARLLPTAMHPWMLPEGETRLWPHDNNEIYHAFDRIFNCKGHGWANVQSAHINLPFANDEEFSLLHTAIRTLLPILPALSASSPIVEGKLTGLVDNRLHFYRHNAAKVPSVTGAVVPEAVYSKAQYKHDILEPIYRDMVPLDPQGLLRFEWCNARGAIARFMRNTIEIRVLDVQEAPRADIAIASLIVATLRALVEGRIGSLGRQRDLSTKALAAIFDAVVRDGELTVIEDESFLRALGFESYQQTVRDIWAALYAKLEPELQDHEAIELLLNQGPLSRRITRSLSAKPEREALRECYRTLADCLQTNELFSARQDSVAAAQNTSALEQDARSRSSSRSPF